MLSITSSRAARGLLAAGLATGTLGGSAAAASADTLKVTAPAIGCCAADTATSVSWGVTGPTAATPHPSFSNFVVTLPVDINTFEFYRLAALGTSISSVTYSTPASSTTYCTAGDKLANMSATSTSVTLTFSFTQLWTESGKNSFGYDLSVFKPLGSPSAACM